MVTSPEVKLRRSGQHLENQYNIYISFEDGPISKKFDSLMQSDMPRTVTSKSKSEVELQYGGTVVFKRLTLR